MAGNEGSFFTELKRRNVYRVGIAYVIASWIILQIIDVVEPIIGIPPWVPKLILVLLAIGFPLALIFSWAYEMTPDGLKKEKEVDRTQSITQDTAQRLDRIIIAILAVAVIVLLGDRYFLSTPQQAVPEPVAQEATTSEPAIEVTQTDVPSIAVLPFMNMSADESSTYFSDGLADTLLHMLAQIREIRVAARTSSFQFRDQNTDITKIAEALNVGAVLEGSVQRAGNKIRVTAQLIEANSGYHLWSGNFDRDLDDVFAIQDEIANEVVAALKVSLLGESAEKLTEHDTDSVDAYTEYLLGINDLNQYTFESLPRAEQRFRNAIALDPGYATAWAKLGYAYLTMLNNGIGTRAEMIGKAKDAASRALELDENSAMAIAVLGAAEDGYGKKDLAEQLYQRAMEINPNDVTALLFYTGLLEADDRRDEALAILQQILTVDPLSTEVHNQLSLHYRFVRQFDAGFAVTERLREIAPESPISYYRNAELEFARGNWAQAVAATFEAMERDPDDPEIATMIGDYYLALGMPADARKWFDRAAEVDASHPVSLAAPLALQLASGTVGSNDIAIARQYIEKGIDDRQGVRGFVLQVLWQDAIANDNWDATLELLRDYFPQYFAEDFGESQWSVTTDWFVGAMLMDAGEEELAMRILGPMLERSGKAAARYGTGMMQTWNLAATRDKEGLLAALRELRADGRAHVRWRTALERMPAFDFVRDEPEYTDYIAFLEQHAAEQREELKKLLGTDEKKRGPI